MGRKFLLQPFTLTSIVLTIYILFLFGICRGYNLLQPYEGLNADGTVELATIWGITGIAAALSLFPLALYIYPALESVLVILVTSVLALIVSIGAGRLIKILNTPTPQQKLESAVEEIVEAVDDIVETFNSVVDEFKYKAAKQFKSFKKMIPNKIVFEFF